MRLAGDTKVRERIPPFYEFLDEVRLNNFILDK